MNDCSNCKIVPIELKSICNEKYSQYKFTSEQTCPKNVLDKLNVYDEQCINCKQWNLYINDNSSQLTPLNMPKIKDNCSTWLCNNGTCPKDKSN